MVEHVVHRHHVGAGQGARNRKKIWNVYQIAAQALERCAKFAIAAQRSFRRGQWNRLKIERQSADLFNFAWRPDKKILILAIQPSQRAHDISEIGTDAELGHPPDVDRDLHGWHLTTE